MAASSSPTTARPSTHSSTSPTLMRPLDSAAPPPTTSSTTHVPSCLCTKKSPMPANSLVLDGMHTFVLDAMHTFESATCCSRFSRICSRILSCCLAVDSPMCGRACAPTSVPSLSSVRHKPHSTTSATRACLLRRPSSHEEKLGSSPSVLCPSPCPRVLKRLENSADESSLAYNDERGTPSTTCRERLPKPRGMLFARLVAAEVLAVFLPRCPSSSVTLVALCLCIAVGRTAAFSASTFS
mmetsp:Transcript_76650/g.112281  ORF Transcript_76650/g.112281 Transcript_76650/m.112281 type:complete len:240 (+) Transcript_76650:1001-1720(+)